MLCFPDWEATNEAIEEQVARESYLTWLRDNERRTASHSKSATVTSADLKAATEAAASAVAAASSPSRAKTLIDEETKAARSSPKPGCSHSTSSETAQFTVSLFLTANFILILKNYFQSFKSIDN